MGLNNLLFSLFIPLQWFPSSLQKPSCTNHIRHQLQIPKKFGCFHGVQAQGGRRRKEELTVSFLSGTTVLILALLVL